MLLGRMASSAADFFPVTYSLFPEARLTKVNRDYSLASPSRSSPTGTTSSSGSIHSPTTPAHAPAPPRSNLPASSAALQMGISTATPAGGEGINADADDQTLGLFCGVGAANGSCCEAARVATIPP